MTTEQFEAVKELIEDTQLKQGGNTKNGNN